MQSLNLHRIASFIDYENLKGPVDRIASPSDIIETIREDLGQGNVVQFNNMYLAMGLPEDLCPVDRNDLYKVYTQGTEPIPIPSFKGSGSERVKNLADSSAIVDIVESLFGHPEITAYSIATGDKDFVPVIRILRKHGKAVRIYYRGECAKVLAAELEWLRGDGFSETINLETLPKFKESQARRGRVHGSTA